MSRLSDPPTFAPTPDISSVSSLIERLRAFFASRGAEPYLVGGVVRDLLLGIQPADVDISVAGEATDVVAEMASALDGHLVPLDEDMDIARVVVPAGESTSYVDVSGRDGALTEDLGRRDFTVNSMAVPLGEGSIGHGLQEVIDPFGGLKDLRAGVIRAVSPSVFEDDPARMLRAPRLSAQLRFAIDDETGGRIRRDAHLVSTVARERVRDELLKLLAEPNADSSVRLLDELDILSRVIPELEEARGVTQPPEHYWDVFDHFIEAVGQVEVVLGSRLSAKEFVAGSAPGFDSMDAYFTEPVSDGHTRMTILKLAALLHDVAKPSTKTIEPSGRIRFLGHHTEGAETAAGVLSRLRVSGRGVELVRTMVAQHLRPSQMAQPGELPSGKAIFRYYRDLGDAAIDTLFLSMADYLAARGPDLARDEWANYCRVIGHVMHEGHDQSAPDALPKLVNGRDIMDVFTLSPGPRIGMLLDVVREAQASGKVKTREEALELVKADLESGGAGA